MLLTILLESERSVSLLASLVVGSLVQFVLTVLVY